MMNYINRQNALYLDIKQWIRPTPTKDNHTRRRGQTNNLKIQPISLNKCNIT